MNKIIYKYPLNFNEINYITMPVGAQILTVQIQNDFIPYVWAVVEDMKGVSFTTRKIALRFTGEDFEGETGAYIGTFTNKSYVIHAFDLGE